MLFKFISILLLFFASCTCQEIVVLDLTYSQQDGVNCEIMKTFRKENWKNENEISVFGWIRIEFIQQQKLSQIFYLSNQEIQDIIPENSAVLQLQLQQSEEYSEVLFKFPINQYEISQKTPQQQQQQLRFNSTLMNEWIFFHLSYSSKQYEKQIIIKTMDGYYSIQRQKVSQEFSLLYELHVGKLKTTSYFPGRIFHLTFQIGQESIDMNEVIYSQGILPYNLPQCPLLFSKCAYTGIRIEACDPIVLSKGFTFKSIYLPNSKSLNLTDISNNQKLKSYNIFISIECTDKESIDRFEVSSQKEDSLPND